MKTINARTTAWAGSIRRPSAISLAIPLLITFQAARGDEPAAKASADNAAPLVLVVDPAAEPVPAFEYRLLPSAEQLRPGNAAPIYLRLLYEKGAKWVERIGEEPDRYLEMPLDQMPMDKVRDMLETFSAHYGRAVRGGGAARIAIGNMCSKTAIRWESCFRTRNTCGLMPGCWPSKRGSRCVLASCTRPCTRCAMAWHWVNMPRGGHFWSTA